MPNCLNQALLSCSVSLGEPLFRPERRCGSRYREKAGLDVHLRRSLVSGAARLRYPTNALDGRQANRRCAKPGIGCGRCSFGDGPERRGHSCGNPQPSSGPEQADLFVAYGGVNDYLSGQNAAQLLIAGAKKAGVELGNGLIVNTVAGHTAAQQRVAGFKDEMKKAFPSSSEVLADVHSGGYLENEGYSIGSQIIPANKGKFNWVYGVNDALAYGAVRAAKESGIQPGKDVLFVGGTCMNSTTNAAVKKGELVGTSVQSPYIEGAAAMYALVAYLNTGKVTDGEQNLSPDTPLSIDAPPHKWNYMPNTMLDGSEKSYAETKIWGKTAQELCNYN